MKEQVLSLSLILILSLGCGTAAADSAYSIYLFGTPLHPVDTRCRGMGDASIGFRNLSLVNPGVAVDSEEASFSLSIRSHLLYTEAEDENALTSGMNFPYFRLAFPLPFGAELGIGLTEQNSFLTRFDSTGEIEGMLFDNRVESKGSLNVVHALLATKIRDILSVGIMWEYMLGSSVEHWYTTFADTLSYLDSSNEEVFIRNTYDIITNTFIGSRFRAGLLAGPFFNIRLGCFAVVNAELPGQRILEGVYSGYEMEEEFETVYPGGAGFGISWSPSEKFLCAADWERIFWSETRIDGAPLSEVSDTDRLSFGLEWFPGDFSNRLSGQIPVRFGYSRLKGYFLDPVTSGTIVQQKLSVGSSLPLPDESGRVDFTLSYLNRGSLPETSLVENQMIFTMSLTGLEIWSRKYAD